MKAVFHKDKKKFNEKWWNLSNSLFGVEKSYFSAILGWKFNEYDDMNGK